MKKVLQKTSSSEARNPVMMWPQAQLRHNDSQPSGVPPFTVTLTMTIPFLRSGLRFGCNQRAGAREESLTLVNRTRADRAYYVKYFGVWTDWRQELEGMDRPRRSAASRQRCKTVELAKP